MACVDVPALPLQLLLRKKPHWSSDPVAVVAEVKPLARILWVTEQARHHGIVPGLRYAAGLSLSPRLKAGSVSNEEIGHCVERLTLELRAFSPGIEPATDPPGIFWLDATGLLRLHSSLYVWAQRLRSNLQKLGFTSSVAIGFSRLGTYAASKTNPRSITYFASEASERHSLLKTPLENLSISTEILHHLNHLGIATIGDFLPFSNSDLVARFGKDLGLLHHLAGGKAWDPLIPEPELEPVQAHVNLEPPEHDNHRLLFSIKRQLNPLLRILRHRHEAAVELALCFKLERHSLRHEYLRTAAPTLDAAQLVDLVRLRLDRAPLPAAVIEIRLEVLGQRVFPEQLCLFQDVNRHSFSAANRALARIRAEFGEQSVCYARLTDAHLPEARFIQKPLVRLQAPQQKSHEVRTRQLVRRFFVKPKLLSTITAEPVDASSELLTGGPHIFDGGWWHRLITREYYFLQDKDDNLYWCFYDGYRKQWFAHGRVE
ncbi:MAG: DNA polymerase Y family protein [Proteobacteria bacterium]|nr:DNA polymerase Y family protein [Pseudomonadota bacterium]